MYQVKWFLKATNCIFCHQKFKNLNLFKNVEDDNPFQEFPKMSNTGSFNHNNIQVGGKANMKTLNVHSKSNLSNCFVIKICTLGFRFNCYYLIYKTKYLLLDILGKNYRDKESVQ